jgi:cell division cycle 14
MEFPDGSNPPDSIIKQFIQKVDEVTSRGHSVAVHCRAGLGRTGTLISLYLMLRYDFSAREAIAWCRLCRPGCVVGSQQ